MQTNSGCHLVQHTHKIPGESLVELLLRHDECTVQYSTVQYSTVQYSTVQYSTVQYSTVQYSTVPGESQVELLLRHDQRVGELAAQLVDGGEMSVGGRHLDTLEKQGDCLQSTVQYSTVQYSTIQYSTVQGIAYRVQYREIAYRVQYREIAYRVQYSRPRHYAPTSSSDNA